MGLVLRAKSKRGQLASFDVVRAEEGTVTELVEGLTAGEYKVLVDNQVIDATTNYRQVQDIQVGDVKTTIDA